MNAKPVAPGSVGVPPTRGPEALAPRTEAQPWLERVEIGPCVLYLGDCLKLLAARVIPRDAAIVTDPPYGIDYQRGKAGVSAWSVKAGIASRTGDESRCIGDDKPFDLTPWLGFAEAAGKRRGQSSGALNETVRSFRLALCGADNYAHQLPKGGGAWYCWDKSCGGGPADSFADAEFLWMSTRNARRVFRHQWKGRLRQDDSGPRHHVMQKPVPLMAWMIETVRTPVGSIVCDPYMGSGTTGIAAIQTGRRFVGCEIDPDHFATACDRIAHAWAAIQGDPDPAPTEGHGR